MIIVGLDLGKYKAHVCAKSDGSVVLERSLEMTRSALEKTFRPLLPCKVLIESSPSSEWVARHLESLGVEVIVADPTFGPMYARADKRIKTDKRDARALCDALQLGAFRKARRRDDGNWLLRTSLTVRDTFVRTRSKLILKVRSVLDRDGHVIRGKPEQFLGHVSNLPLGAAIKAVLAPLLEHIKSLNETIAKLDEAMEKEAKENKDAVLLDSVVGVGPITSLAVVTALEDPKNFSSSSQVASYLGLVPREDSSGERKARGRITKVGDRYVRALLVECAHTIWRSKRPEVAGLVRWANRVAERRGKMRAVVGLARRLARILFAMWRNNAPFDATRFV